MLALDDAAVAAALPWPELIAAVEAVMVDPDATAPPRTAHTIPGPTGDDTFLLMKPAWITGRVIGIKCVTFFPDNGSRGLPTVQAAVLLFDGATGSVLGACEANELTARRTAAASAVAAARLARSDARRLLVVGAGALAPMVAQAHAQVRPIDAVSVWARDPVKAVAVVDRLVADQVLPRATVEVCVDLDDGVADADIVSCVTGATEPLVRGALLRPGAHLDLIGSFTAAMRESDDDCVRRATVFVDTHEDAVLAGDLAQPLATGLLRLDDIAGDLADLVAGRHPGRRADDEITLFKSAGTALEDLAAAGLAFGPG